MSRINQNLILALCLALGAPASAQEGTKDDGTIVVNITKVKSKDGRVGCSLFSSEEGFPSKSDKAEKRLWAKITSEKVTCTFTSVKPGRYAVAVMHDEDNNGKVNTSMVGRPKEGWGVSNNVPARRFGPPKFEDASFQFEGGEQVLDVRLRY